MTSRPASPDADPVYVRAVLDAYRRTAATTGHVRASDRRIAEQLCRRGVSLDTVKDALFLATARRFVPRRPDAPPPGLARSLAYFLPVIDELAASPLQPGYRSYLVANIARLQRKSD